MFKNLFRKRVPIFKKRDRETWKQIRATLREAGVKGVRSGHYLQETVMGGGCGAKLDPRDFGGRGRIDRDIYWVEVLPEDEKRVRELLRRNGIVPVVEENVLQDAALRKRPPDESARL
ncbi:MAG: hypothetical protein IKQ10_10195 [Oscillospiraceae bacterium]|nr:hypothetical protein [Oscillospiraceae bacterium]